MPSNEDLYREMEAADEAFADEFAHLTKNRPLLPDKKPPPLVNAKKARERFEREIKPVLERRRRAEAGQSITGSVIKDFILKVTGKATLAPIESFDIVEPSKGLQQFGMKAEEVRQDMIDHPEKYPANAKSPGKLFKKDFQ